MSEEVVCPDHGPYTVVAEGLQACPRCSNPSPVPAAVEQGTWTLWLCVNGCTAMKNPVDPEKLEAMPCFTCGGAVVQRTVSEARSPDVEELVEAARRFCGLFDAESFDGPEVVDFEALRAALASFEETEYDGR